MTPYDVLAECVFLERSAATIIEELEAAGYRIVPIVPNDAMIEAGQDDATDCAKAEGGIPSAGHSTTGAP